MNLKKSFMPILVSALAIITVSCKGRRAATDATFPMPEVPAIVTDVHEYVATHFWNRYFIELPRCNGETLEKTFWEYVALLCNIPVQTGIKAQYRFVELLENHKKNLPADTLWNTFTDLQEKAFFDPNSPFRNEDFYIPVAENLTKSPFASPEKKLKAETILPFIKLNGVGTKAGNFSFTLPDGSKKDLYSINSDYIVLMFSNLGCNECKNEIESLQNPAIAHLISDGKLNIVTIYPDDDYTEWRKNANDYPQTWINGYDHDHVVMSKPVYYLRAIPSLYLLDRDKTVILKDAPVEIILNTLLN